MSGLVERLLEPDYHDPACPFKNHCYCGEDENPHPHDKVRHPLALEAAARIQSLEAQVAKLTEAGSRVLEWWPSNSEFGPSGDRMGDGFARDIQGLRHAVKGTDHA